MKTYFYKCKIVKVVDGDTVDASIDLGFSISVKKRIRLARINAAEKNSDIPSEQEDSKKAITRLSELCNESSDWFLDSLSVDPYGRIIGELYRSSNNKPIETSLSTILLNESLVKRYPK